MSIKKLAELQSTIVSTIANSINDDWDAAVVSMEMLDTKDGKRKNCLSLSYKLVQNCWQDQEFFIPNECFELFSLLRESCEAPKWSSCILEFNAEGKYKFSYSFEAPSRINGNHDDKAMLIHYQPPDFLD